MNVTAILLSGGKGTRMGASTPKQYLFLEGKPIASYSFELLIKCPLISEVITVCEPVYEQFFPGSKFARPGKRRQDSLSNGVEQLSDECDTVLVHDSARPLLQQEDLEKVILVGNQQGAAALSTPITTTIKQADEHNKVTKTLDRSTLFTIQTPQVLKKELLIKGLTQAKAEEITVTDDVSLVELFFYPVQLVEGSVDNIKITTPYDLTFAETILRGRLAACQI